MKAFTLVCSACLAVMLAGLLHPLLCKDHGAPERSEAEVILSELAESYRSEVPSGMSVIVHFNIQPEDEQWVLEIKEDGGIALSEGVNPGAAFVFTMSLETLKLIYEGQMTAMTAGGKGSGADSAPLEFEFTEAAADMDNALDVAFQLLLHFFNRAVPERVLLDEEHSRVVHGAHVVPLYYAPGFRSGWYMVKKGQKLNEPGDTNPFPQAFVIISGQGFGMIGDETIEVRAGESYYIPPASDHVLWTEDDQPLVLIWFGWGEGA